VAADTRIERNLPRLVIGLSIIAAGILFTLDNLHVIEADSYLSYWPVVLVVIGFAQLAQARTWGSVAWSLVLVIVGFWILGQNLGFVHMSIWTLSPLLLVLLGASLVYRAFSTPAVPAGAAPGAGAQPDAFVRGMAVMGGIDRASDSAEFVGADLIALMGACKLDLRRATMAGNEAVIDILAVMGGIELRIPDNWIVDPHVLPLMGGVSDETHPVSSGPVQRLVLRGTAFMGGVEIKN